MVQLDEFDFAIFPYDNSLNVFFFRLPVRYEQNNLTLKEQEKEISGKRKLHKEL